MNITFTSTKPNVTVGRWIWPSPNYSITLPVSTVGTLNLEDLAALKQAVDDGSLSSDQSLEGLSVQLTRDISDLQGREVRALVDGSGNVYLMAVGLGPIKITGSGNGIALGVIDNLADGGSSLALSAEQGKVLNQTKYSKPNTGIPVGDLSPQVQASLIKADNALTTAPVVSVSGKSGVVALNVTDIQGLGSAASQPVSAFASAAQGLKADTALQAAPVTSVAGRIGAVTLTPSDIAGIFDQVATKQQGLKADSALQASSAGAPNGVATLGADGKIEREQIPDLSIVDYLGRVSNQADMLSLAGQMGDWCIRADIGRVFVITSADTSSPTSWTSLEYPGGDVVSVAGKTGAVTLTVSDIQGLGSAAAADLSDIVRTVNGISPDSSGNVTVASTGAVWTVAGRSGDVSLSASDILGLGSAALQSTSSFASAEQGLLATTALQTGVADMRYIRTVNGQGPDTSGDVVVAVSWPTTLDGGSF